jgi:hypothetical protein
VAVSGWVLVAIYSVAILFGFISLLIAPELLRSSWAWIVEALHDPCESMDEPEAVTLPRSWDEPAAKGIQNKRMAARRHQAAIDALGEVAARPAPRHHHTTPRKPAA